MRVKELHPLCCISLESPATGTQSPDISLSRNGSVSGSSFPIVNGSDGNAIRSGLGSEASVAGVLYKWTNYGKGWRSRWFVLRNGVLSYSKIRVLPENLNTGDEVRVIGDASTARLTRMDSCGRRKQHRSNAVVHLKVSSYRESRSDDRKFYIFTATKTLHLRTNSRREKEAWIEALASSRGLFVLRPLNDSLPLSPSDLLTSTERLRRRLVEEGVNESLVKDCEEIMRSEFSEIQGQLKLHCEERSNLLDTLRQLEASNIEAEAAGLHDRDYRLANDGYSNLGRGKYSEYSTTESSDDIEKQEFEEVSDEEEISYYDTRECFPDSRSSGGLIAQANGMKEMQPQQSFSNSQYLHIERRKKLPDPVEKEKGVSLWSLIKDNVGKDLTRVCLPVYFNEPISSLQKCCEDLEYSYLLDQAFEHGKAGNSLLRMVHVAAFAVSGYASSEGRLCKPFNPLLGETYEADFPEKGIRFFSEKVSHHPTVIACHCEGRGWRFWADSNLKTKFWGPSIQVDPVGVLTLEFDDGEIFQWSKVTTSIYNVVLGKLYCDHHGTMHIRGNRQYSCKVKFKGQSLFDRNPHQVHGIVEDVMGNRVASISGKWDESLHYDRGDGSGKSKEASLIWTRIRPPPNVTRYNLTSFAITLNELTPGLQDKLPPTDSRLRPDQRHLENGEYERANEEKLRLEKRQRMSRTLQEKGWKPRWFNKEGEDGGYRYIGGYWEARDQAKWDDCPNIFTEDVNESAQG